MKKLTIFLLTVMISSCLHQTKDGLQTDIVNNSFKMEVEKQNILFGTAVEPHLLDIDAYQSTLKTNFNFITPENVMKWQFIHPQQDTYDFSASDKLVNFAINNNMKVRGHTLVWHSQNPGWLESMAKGLSREELMEILKDHITTVVEHYKGKIFVWDVINEGLSDGGDYRKTIWYEGIGPDYMEMAFKWAREADPEALLIYNDYNVGEIGVKSDRLLELVTDLKDKGVPVDGVGFQLHIDMSSSFDFASLYKNVSRFVEKGFFVDFTEIDIRFKGEPTPDKLEKQATYYKKLMEIMLAFKTCHAFSVWGLSDAHSWVPNFFVGSGHALLFDLDYKSKPAFDSIYSALVTGPVELSYTSESSDNNSGRHAIPPFIANPVSTPPTIDGDPSDAQWNAGVTYPFAFNQLAEHDLYIKDEYKDIFGEWVIVYKDSTLYGRVRRVDEKTVTSASNDYECDNVEIFFSLNKQWAQLRSIVGNDWQPHNYKGNQKAIWNEDGTVMEFSVDLPIHNLAGQRCGWNIALSDNDSGKVRQGQFYPINGVNDGWQGKGFGTMTFVGNAPNPPEEPLHFVKPFLVNPVSNAISVDGDLSDPEWTKAAKYGFAFNQLNVMDQLPPKDYKDFSGYWGLVRNNTTLYGFIKKQDNITVSNNVELFENDHVVIALKIDTRNYLFQAVAGRPFEKNEFEGVTESKWSNDGSQFEFKIELTKELFEKPALGFNIAIADNDGTGLKYKLFPIPGEDKIIQGFELGEIQCNMD